MSNNKSNPITNALQSYRVLSINLSESWKRAIEDPYKFSDTDYYNLPESEQQIFTQKRTDECEVAFADSIRQSNLWRGTLSDLIRLIPSEGNKMIPKLKRKVIFSTTSHTRPTGKRAFSEWNGLQIIDMDIKNQSIAIALKYHIFQKLCTCNWFLGVTLSSSGAGLHIYTKITIPDGLSTESARILYLTNFRHKYSFVYIACLDAGASLGFEKDELISWMDLSMFRPTQGAFIGYDPHPLISTNFMEDFIYVGFDEPESIGHPEIDWVTHPDLVNIFRRWEWFETPEYEVNILSKDMEICQPINPIHYKHTERWRLANTLVRLFGFEMGYKYLCDICAPEIPKKELRADCITARKHNKPVDIWALNRLNSLHGFHIHYEDTHNNTPDSPQGMLGFSASNGLIITPDAQTITSTSGILGLAARDYHELFLERNTDYLSILSQKILELIRGRRLCLLEAGPGLGKTEWVRRLVTDYHKKIMLVMPFTSTIKSKIEKDPSWYYSYSGRRPRLDVRGLALTLDKFSHLNPMELKTAGFELIIIDESHLLFMSEYRDIMPNVIDLICHCEVPIILMTGTPTGEIVFFPDLTHIRVLRRTESRKKSFEVHLVEKPEQILPALCKSIASDIMSGKRVLFPTNRGTVFSKQIIAGTEYFLSHDYSEFGSISAAYYKKSEHGEKFMDDINFKKTISEIQLLLCTSYLSVGVDILDKYDFQIYFGDLFTAVEIDQWANRLRERNLPIRVFVSRHDSDGSIRLLNKFTPINFRLPDAEIRDIHSLLQICNSLIKRNPQAIKYNAIISSILHNNRYIRYNEMEDRYILNETAFKLFNFERKYREYATQLPILMYGMRQYGYTVTSVMENCPGASELIEFRANISLARKKSQESQTENIISLLEYLSPEKIDAYREVLKGHYELRKGLNWHEDYKSGIVTVRSIEIFEKVIPLVMAFLHRFELGTIKKIFQYCRDGNNGTFNFSHLNRLRILISILDADILSRLDKPLSDFFHASLCFARNHPLIDPNILSEWIWHQVSIFAHLSSDKNIPVYSSENTLLFLFKTFEKIFRCIINIGPQKSGLCALSPVEIFWSDTNQVVHESENIDWLFSFLHPIGN